MSTATLSALQKVWFITGTSSGLGRELALAALARGDKVVATARSTSRVADLEKEHPDACRALQLDVTDDYRVLRQKAADAVGTWGRVDVLVNNAGAGKFGFSEEVGEDGYATQFRTNFFGPMNVTHAFLPYMRARREGTVIFIGSRSSWRANVPVCLQTLKITSTGLIILKLDFNGAGTYNASKAALTAAAEALGAEVGPLGIRILNVIPGGLRTKNWDNMELLQTTLEALLPPLNGTSPTLLNSNNGLKDYDPMRTQLLGWMKAQNGKQPGDPVASARAIVDVVRGEVDVSQAKTIDTGSDEAEPKSSTQMRETSESQRIWPDLDMLVLGSDAEANIREKCERVVRNLDDWQDVIRSIDLKD